MSEDFERHPVLDYSLLFICIWKSWISDFGICPYQISMLFSTSIQ